MYKLICLLLTSLIVPSFSDKVVDTTELVLTFLIHRHGDRTPVKGTLAFSNEAETLSRLSAKYGYGQLTDAGKRRSFELGQFIRQRYGELLSPQYNKSEIYIRSTDSTRAKMTALAAMAAVYPVGADNWSQYLRWTPVPYTTVPAKHDFNLATFNCPVYSTYFSHTLTAPTPLMAKYDDLLEKISFSVDLNFTQMPMMAYVLNDVINSQISLGLPLEREMEKLHPQLEDAAAAVLDIIMDHGDNAALNAGVLLNEFFKVADQKIAGENVPGVHIYSAHDLNVYAFEVVTKAFPRQGVPKYTATYALELRKTRTGEHIVVPVYLSNPSEDVIKYLSFDGCEYQCDYESFRRLTEKSHLEEKEWREMCEFDEDYDFDTSTID